MRKTSGNDESNKVKAAQDAADDPPAYEDEVELFWQEREPGHWSALLFHRRTGCQLEVKNQQELMQAIRYLMDGHESAEGEASC